MGEHQSDQPDDPQSEPARRKKRSAARYQIVEPTLFVTDAELIRRKKAKLSQKPLDWRSLIQVPIFISRGAPRPMKMGTIASP